MFQKCVITLISALGLHFGTAFIIPNFLSDKIESFSYENKEYLFINHPSSWLEARYICNSYPNGRLVVANTDEVGDFLAVALVGINFGAEALWIGANRMKNNTDFVWLGNVGVIPRASLHPRSNLESVRFYNPRNCLAITRVFHDKFSLVNLECQIKRSFICERTSEIRDDSLTINDWVSIGPYTYGIYSNRVTWSQAAFECTKRDAHLASFHNIQEVRFVARLMLIGRPSLEAAWFGGIAQNGAWAYLNGVPISMAKNETTGYPPWPSGDDIKPGGCLILDRHVTNDFSFINSHCNRLRGYICSRGTSSRPDYNVVIVNNIGYVLYYIKKSWEHAQKKCHSHSGGLAYLNNYTIHDITAIMSEGGKVVDHVWIGARYDDSIKAFRWTKNKERIQKSTRGILFFPPWYSDNYDARYKCLNLDREHHNHGILYGLDCDIPQAFICEQTNLKELPKQYEDAIYDIEEEDFVKSKPFEVEEEFANDEINFVN